MINISTDEIKEIKAKLNIIKNDKNLKISQSTKKTLDSLNKFYLRLFKEFDNNVEEHLKYIKKVFDIEVSKPRYLLHIKVKQKKLYNLYILNVLPPKEVKPIEPICDKELDKSIESMKITSESMPKSRVQDEDIEIQKQMIDKINNLKDKNRKLNKKNDTDKVIKITLSIAIFIGLCFVAYHVI